MSDLKNALAPGTLLYSGKNTYQVVKPLGSGGFGITYLVQAQINQGGVVMSYYYAMKEHFLSRACERNNSEVIYSNPVANEVQNSQRDFLAEAKRLQDVGTQHDNIVHVNEIFNANNTSYYVMEFLSGDSLRKYVNKRGRLSEQEMLQIMNPIIDAIGFIHANNMTHLDVKPDNIMLTQAPDGGIRPVLIDFGLSKHYDETGRATSTINTLGCSDGFSPVEQYGGITTFQPTADIYALAATMAFCLTGTNPKKSTDMLPGEAANYVVGTSASVGSTIVKMMDMNRAARPQSINEVKELLTAPVPTQPVSPPVPPIPPVPPVPPTPPTEKPKLKKWEIGLLVTIAACIAIGAIVSLCNNSSSNTATTERGSYPYYPDEEVVAVEEAVDSVCVDNSVVEVEEEISEDYSEQSNLPITYANGTSSSYFPGNTVISYVEGNVSTTYNSNAISRARRAPGSGDVKITLVWDFNGDLDLIANTANAKDVYYGQHSEEWTGASYSGDQTGGYGSYESINFSTPKNGLYDAFVRVRSVPSNGGDVHLVVTIDNETKVYSTRIKKSGSDIKDVRLANFYYDNSRYSSSSSSSSSSNSSSSSSSSSNSVAPTTYTSGSTNSYASGDAIDSYYQANVSTDYDSYAVTRASSLGRSGQLRVTLLWDFSNDLDLIVNQSDGKDIYFGNTSISATGAQYSGDQTGGNRSWEQVTWSNPSSGLYDAFVRVRGTLSEGGTVKLVVTDGGSSTVYTTRIVKTASEKKDIRIAQFRH